MKRFLLLFLLLALLLSLTGCFTITGDTTDTSPEGKQEEPEEQHLTADVDETQVWQRTTGAPWTGGEPQTVSADFERISGAAAQGMTVGQELLLLDFMDCYYQSVADLRVIDPAVLFADSEETLYHKNIWHGLCVIRKLSPIDLTMTSYSYSLRCVSITPSEETEGDVDLVLRENNVVYFKGLNGLPSEQFGIKHTFTLRGEGDDWSIVKHWSDDNPYYSADYDRTTHQDKNFPAITDYIEVRRDLPREGLSVTAAADHTYDRDAARAYMLTWVGKRNPAFMAYDDYGGNCMNFGSQVLAAGGIPIAEGMPVVREGRTRAWVSIMYGCNNFCSYCIVPYVRGRERSRDPERIIDEVRELVADGFKEITLLGQNVNSYGKDLGTGYDFADLLTDLDKIDGDYLIRFMSSQPKDATYKLFDAMAGCRHVAKQLHLPVQSGCDRVLRAMNRPYDVAKYLDLITYARRVMPDLVLTSDVIIGFPGETESEAMETVALVEKVRFDALFTFIFSPRPGTPAAKMDDPVPREEKQRWFDRLCAVQNGISEELHRQYVGQTLRCLVDGESDDARWPLTARTAGGRLVHCTGDRAALGEYRDVKITDSNTWALFGTIE